MPRIMPALARLAAATATSLFLTTAGYAQSQMYGGGVMSQFTQACTNGNHGPLQTVMVRFRPAGQGGNPAEWHSIAVNEGAYTWHLWVPSSAEIGAWVPAYFSAIGSRPYEGDGLTVQLLAVPDDVARDGEALLMGNIASFELIPGCNVRFSAFLRSNI